MTDALVVVLVLLPAVLAFFFKSSASMAFLSLCGGFAVVTLSGSDIEHLVGKTKITSLTSNNIDLALLTVPLLLSLILTYRSVTSKSRRYLQTVPALCAGALLAVVAGPMFSDAIQTNLTDSPIWKALQSAQAPIVGIGLLTSLLLSWTAGSKHPHKKHK